MLIKCRTSGGGGGAETVLYGMCVCVCVYMYVCMYVCMYACMYMCVYVHVCINHVLQGCTNLATNLVTTCYMLQNSIIQYLSLIAQIMGSYYIVLEGAGANNNFHVIVWRW